VTAVQPPTPNEPAQPQRGQTREERGRDISEAQAEAEAETSKVKQYLKIMSPRYLFSMAEEYPVVLKQFIQFCLIIIYPAWVLGVLFGAVIHVLFYITVYPVLWLLFWPVRAHQKKHHPEEYAANRAKYKKKK
jgi:fatty acid desaturase